MEISNVVSHQYAFFIPVALVIICAVLVFAFGFKSSVEPPNFKQLSLLSDVKKTVKKRKVKDKKSQSNGHATVIIEDSKTLKQVNKIESKSKEKKSEAKSPAKQEKKKENKAGKENQLILANKKNETKYEERIDHDDGEWEIAYTKKDKKNRKKEEETVTPQSPEKTPQKNKRQDKAAKAEEAAIEILKKKAEESQKVPEETVHLPPKVEDEQKDESKNKKNNKKPKQEKEEEIIVANEVVAEEVKPVEAPEPPAEEVKQTTNAEPEKKAEEPVAGAAFDELGDVWKEATQKKSKKKVRKD